MQVLLGQQAQCGADQGVGLAQIAGHGVEPVVEVDAFRLGHQQTEGHRLRVAVGEGGIVRIGEQQRAPVLLEAGKSAVVDAELLQHFVAQEAAQAGGDLRELPGVTRRDRVPGEEIGHQRQQSGRRAELRAGTVDAAFEVQDIADTLPIAPQR